MNRFWSKSARLAARLELGLLCASQKKISSPIADLKPPPEKAAQPGAKVHVEESGHQIQPFRRSICPTAMPIGHHSRHG